MTHILLVDDDFSRIPVLENFYRTKFENAQFTHVTRLPDRFDGFEVLSLDNDVIVEDVSEELSRRYRGRVGDTVDYDLAEEFHRNFCGDPPRFVIVHSCNPTAYKTISGICDHLGMDHCKMDFGEILKVIKGLEIK
jgi:hypothetical protein